MGWFGTGRHFPPSLRSTFQGTLAAAVANFLTHAYTTALALRPCWFARSVVQSFQTGFVCSYRDSSGCLPALVLGYTFPIRAFIGMPSPFTR